MSDMETASRTTQAHTALARAKLEAAPMTPARAAEILAAKDHPHPVQRRLKLRQLASDNIKPNAELVEQAMKASRLIGEGRDQIKSATTGAAYRDLLDVETLFAIAASGEWLRHSLKAVLTPSIHGVTAKSKSGYRFGKPRDLSPPQLDVLRSQLLRVAGGVSTTAPPAPAPLTPTGEAKDMSASNLDIIINVFRYFYDGGSAGASREAVIEAIYEAWNGLAEQEGLAPITMDGIITILREEEGGERHIPDDFFVRGELASHLLNATRAKLNGPADDKIEARHESADAERLREPGTHEAKVIDVVLASQGLPPIREMVRAINTSKARILDLEEEVSTKRGMSLTMAAPVEIEAKGDIPKGKVKTMKAHEAMGLERGKDAFDFDVPVWEWDHEHPHVPAKDEDYIFQPFVLLRALYALVTNQRSWIYGHTGTGKSTLVEQICARLNWPMARVNFDSEITRLDLVGREALREEGGTTVSHFVEGILPQAMQQPVVMLMDEMDYIRPDVSYVLQRVTEGNGLLLTEDGGRLVKPHPMFRIMATANTQGQGDEYGMYAGARQQSMAFLDRFTSWIEVEYLTLEQRKKLLAKRVPDLKEAMREELARYSEEHIEAFKQGKVMQPLSPRGMIEAGRALAAFTSILPKASRKKAVQEALGAVLLDRATPQDRAVLRGIADRVFT